jgi:hypothetical protein
VHKQQAQFLQRLNVIKVNMLALSVALTATSKFVFNAQTILSLVKNKLALQFLLPVIKTPNWSMEFVFSTVGTDSITTRSRIAAWPVLKIA